jgi:hypothetical protein
MATQINSFYKNHAMQFATISEDGLTVTLPSEKRENVSYDVHCKETAHGVEAVSCQCYGFRRWSHCKHITIVQEWLDEQAPVVPAEPKITEIEPNAWYIVNSDSQVWRDAETGQWMTAGLTANAIEIVEAYLAKQQAVAAAEEIIAAPVVEVAEVAMAEVAAAPVKPLKVTLVADAPKSDTEKLSRVLATQEVDLGFLGQLTNNRGFQLLR